MAKCIVVADDLTGANATGVLLKKQGYDTYTILDAARGADAALVCSDCLVLPTHSRSIPKEEAYRAVFQAVTTLKGPGVQLYSKRIDSTLRGNLGSETDAFLNALSGEYMAVCVPCFPSSGRVLCGGYLLVNGVPLDRTEAAADPKNPIRTADAAHLFGLQSRYPVASLRLEDLAQGVEHLSRRFCELKAQGARTVVCDAVTQQDIELIADAVLAAAIPFVAVDPGVFTAAVAGRMIPARGTQPGGKILCAIGSVNGVARKQVELLLKTIPVHTVLMQIGEILESDERRQQEIGRVTEELLTGCHTFDICAIIGSGIDPARRVAFEPYMERQGCTADALSEQINTAFAQVVYQVLLARKDMQGIYTTGGDITAAVNRQLGTSGLQLLDEVVPLAGYGRIMGGAFDGLRFISKGGMVGAPDAMVTCMRYMKEHF